MVNARSIIAARSHSNIGVPPVGSATGTLRAPAEDVKEWMT